MNIKMKLLACLLMGYIGIAMALEPGDEIYGNHYNTWIFNNIAVKITGSSNLAERYRVAIYTINTTIHDHPRDLSEVFKPVVQTVDKRLWVITSDQLPLTLDDCMEFHLIPCEKDGKYCYKYCLSNLDPEIVAFDERNKKVYLNYGSYDIGTGGGPSLLFVADIDKRTIKLLNSATWEQKGSISPSSRYLVLYGSSVLRLYDTKTNTWLDLNQSENDYSRDPHIFHYLEVKKWINDTQFIYVDHSRYFVRNSDPQPFISAKEFTYDIKSKTRSGEMAINEMEYKKFIKELHKHE